MDHQQSQSQPACSASSGMLDAQHTTPLPHAITTSTTNTYSSLELNIFEQLYPNAIMSGKLKGWCKNGLMTQMQLRVDNCGMRVTQGVGRRVYTIQDMEQMKDAILKRGQFGLRPLPIHHEEKLSYSLPLIFKDRE